MKNLIISFVLIAGVIVFFTIAGRRDFNRHNDIQTIQSKGLTTNIKPLVSVSEMPPAAEMKFQVETSPVEMKPAEIQVVTTLSGTNKVTDKSAKTQLIAETKSEEKTAAVSSASLEKTEKPNKESKGNSLPQKKKEPFFNLYQDIELETVCFQGTVRAASIIPDPEKNDYENCLYALFIEIDSLLSEISPDMKIASEVIVDVPILKDKMLLEDYIFYPGDRVYCLCADYDTMPQAIQEIQVSDDIQSYEHQQYFPLEIKRISIFQKGGNRNFSKREITILPIQSLPIDEDADRLRSERIQSEIKRIEKELEQHGGSFASWKEEYKPIGEKYKQLVRESYSCWMNDAFFAAGGGGSDGKESTYKTRDYIESILPYKDYLKKNNIDLIILRIPTRGDFAARVLASEDFQENPAWVEHYYECLKNDIEIVDPMPEMWNHRFDLPLFYYYTSNNDYHPFEGTYWYASIALGKILKRYQYDKTSLPFELKREKTERDESQFKYPSGNPKYTSNIEYNHVLSDGKVLEDLKSNSGSPFVFLSNSFFGKYLINDLALPIYCAYQLQTIPDWYYQQSLGPSMLYNLISAPELLSNRRVVIMIGCSHQGLFGRIHELPKYILDDAKNISLEKTLTLDSPDLLIADREQLDLTPNDDGGATIKPNNKLFSFILSVPKVEGKDICMIRINFVETRVCTFKIYDLDTNTLIESDIQISAGKNSHQDLFIPLASDSRRIKIDFITSYQRIRNLELWYY